MKSEWKFFAAHLGIKWLNSGVVDPWLGIPQAVPRQGIERGISRHQWRPLCYTMQAVKRQEDTADASADDRIGQSESRDLDWCYQIICIIYAEFCEQPIGTSRLVSRQHSRGNVQWWISRSPTSSDHQWLKIPTGVPNLKAGTRRRKKAFDPS